MKITSIAFLAMIVLLSDCAHYADVTPGKDGVNQVTTVPDDDDEDPDEDELIRDAMNQATDYCEAQFKLKPQIISAKKIPIQGAQRPASQVVVKFKCR